MKIKKTAELLLSVLLLLSPTAVFPDTGGQITRILFIGDGYLSKNRINTIYESLAESAGHETETGISTIMVGSLSDHSAPGRTINRIKNEEWDYIVLQENIAIAESAHDAQNDMYQAIREINSVAGERGIKTILFIPWAYPDGCPAPDNAAMDKMQESLTDTHLKIAEEIGAILAPAGEAWKSVRKDKPQMVLWNDIWGYPKLQGSYLAACVIYAAVYGDSPLGLTYEGGMTPEDCRFLQQKAAETVLADPARWGPGPRGE